LEKRSVRRKNIEKNPNKVEILNKSGKMVRYTKRFVEIIKKVKIDDKEVIAP
jgi:hypothetical protein